jgi:hypothetical protein
MTQRALLTSIALFALSTAARADPRDEMLATLAKCTDVPDRLARFDCYERLAPQIRTLAQLPAAEPQPPQTQAPQPQAAQPPQTHGSWLNEHNPFAHNTPAPGSTQYQPMGGEILPMQIGVADYTIAPSGSFTVTLDNGQVWREHDRDFDTPSFAKDKKNIVVIQRGLLGGCDLHIKGTSKFFKVVRVK